MIDELFGKTLHKKFTCPLFFTIVIHTFGDSIVGNICLATCSACFEITIHAFYGMSRRYVVFFCTYETRHVLNECTSIYLYSIKFSLCCFLFWFLFLFLFWFV